MTILSSSDLVSPGLLARDLNSIPAEFNEYSASTTAVPDDLLKLVLMNAAGANVYTIPTDAALRMQLGKEASIGHRLVVCQFGAGATTIQPASGVSLLNGVSVAIAGQWQCVCAIRYMPNTWFVIGAVA